MLSSLLKGFKIFANKKTIAIIILFLISFFGMNYLVNYIISTFSFEMAFPALPIYIINYYSYELILLLLGFFGVYFLSNYVIYLIAHAMFKSKKNPIKDISKVLVYSIFTSILFLFFCFIMYLILLAPGIISIILLIILAIVVLVISLIISLSILFLAISKTIKESFDRAWLFLKKKFWLLLVLLILLGLINFIISFGFTYLSNLLLSNSPYAELILQSVTNTILIMYTTAVIASFIIKKK